MLRERERERERGRGREEEERKIVQLTQRSRMSHMVSTTTFSLCLACSVFSSL